MAKFEFVSRFADAGLPLPERKTASSAGYDLTVAEDTVIPSFFNHYSTMCESLLIGDKEIFDLDTVAKMTKSLKAKPTLVSTGVKCQLPSNTYLELSVRSSCPLKYWLILANGVGVVDADYYNNPDNEGEIFLQLINLSPYTILLKKGDVIGQGIIKPYLTTENDAASGERLGGFGSTNV